jgi:hypothetical protein
MCFTKFSQTAIIFQSSLERFFPLMETLCFLWGTNWIFIYCVHIWHKYSRVEAGSNTSTVTLRVVGGDEKGSLEFETVKFWPENDCTGEGKQQLQTTAPYSRQKNRPKSTNPQLSESNKNLVVSPRWMFYSKRYWPTDSRSQYKTQPQIQIKGFHGFPRF